MNPDKLDTAVTITAEMVERAVEEYGLQAMSEGKSVSVNPRFMRAALAASLPSTGAGMVRGLEWEEIHQRRSDEDPSTEVVGFEAGTGFDAWYHIELRAATVHETEREAKAAAQADYEQRIRSVLVTYPEMQPPAGERIRTTQDGSMEAAPVTGQSPVGAASTPPLSGPVGELDLDWTTTAHVFCDRLGIDRKADAHHIVSAITALQEQMASWRRVAERLEGEKQSLQAKLDIAEEALANIATLNRSRDQLQEIARAAHAMLSGKGE